MRLNLLIRNVLFLTIGSTVLLAACGGGSDNESAVVGPGSSEQKSENQSQSGKSSNSMLPSRPTATPTRTAELLKPPVDFTFHGLSTDKKTVSFSITSPRDITRYVITTRYLDEKGNLVKAILNGTAAGGKVLVSANTPTDLKVNAQIDPKIVSVEGWVAELVFADGTSWKRGQ